MDRDKRRIGRTAPDLATEIHMRRKMQALVRAMYKDIIEQVKPEYEKRIAEDKRNPNIAKDGMDRRFIIRLMKKSRMKWYPKFDELSKELAQWMSRKTYRRADKIILQKLDEYGFTVHRNVEEGYQKAVLKEAVKDSVDLWHTLPQYAAAQAQTTIMNAYAKGRDIGYLTEQLSDMAEISAERAALIARDQMNKTTQTMAIANAKSYGLQKGRWIHVAGEHSSRNTHVEFDGELFDLDTGLYDADVGEYVKPGELIYCNCQFVPVIPGFEE